MFIIAEAALTKAPYTPLASIRRHVNDASEANWVVADALSHAQYALSTGCVALISDTDALHTQTNGAVQQWSFNVTVRLEP